MKTKVASRSNQESRLAATTGLAKQKAGVPRQSKKHKRQTSKDDLIFEGLVMFLLVCVLVAVLIPLWYVVVISFTPYAANQLQGYTLFLPFNQWTPEAYLQLFSSSAFLQALLNSCIITGLGVATNMLLTTLTAYGLTIKGLPGRNLILTLILFTFLFNPGLIPTYLLVKNLNLLNTFAAVILPGAISVFNLFVMKTFFQNLPSSLREAALMDGANEWQILWRVILPLSKPIMLTIGMFYAVGQWNEFFLPILYLNDSNLMPLPVLLRNILTASGMSDYVGQNALSSTPQDALKMAAVILTMLPMLALYPWIQRHFTKGVLLGSVKE